MHVECYNVHIAVHAGMQQFSHVLVGLKDERDMGEIQCFLNSHVGKLNFSYRLICNIIHVIYMNK